MVPSWCGGKMKQRCFHWVWRLPAPLLQSVICELICVIAEDFYAATIFIFSHAWKRKRKPNLKWKPKSSLSLHGLNPGGHSSALTVSYVRTMIWRIFILSWAYVRTPTFVRTLKDKRTCFTSNCPYMRSCPEALSVQLQTCPCTPHKRKKPLVTYVLTIRHMPKCLVNRVFLQTQFWPLFAALLVVNALKFTVTAHSSIRAWCEKCEVGFAKALYWNRIASSKSNRVGFAFTGQIPTCLMPKPSEFHEVIDREIPTIFV